MITSYIVIHRLPGAATQDEVIAAGQAIMARLSDDARWLNSWLVPDDEHLFCEWEASSEKAIYGSWSLCPGRSSTRRDDRPMGSPSRLERRWL